MSKQLSVVGVIGTVAHQLQTIDGFLTLVQVAQHVPPLHPPGHHTTFKQLWGHTFDPQDVRMVHPPGDDDLLAIFLKFQAGTRSEIL